MCWNGHFYTTIVHLTVTGKISTDRYCILNLDSLMPVKSRRVTVSRNRFHFTKTFQFLRQNINIGLIYNFPRIYTSLKY